MKSQRNTLLLARHDGQVRSLAYNPRRVVATVIASLLLLVGSTFYGGIRLGIDLEGRAQLADVHELLAQAHAQQQQVERLDVESRNHIDALALRLGRMQAQLLRLDAAGKRMVSVVDLDDSEFNFDVDPPLGGPDIAAVQGGHDIPDFLAMLGQLELSVADRQEKLSLLEQLIVRRQVSERVTPSGLVVEKGLLSSRFGMRIDPFTGKRGQHKGIDIAGKSGSHILAAGDGLVTYAGSRKGYGNLVEVDHGDGYITRYAHNRAHLVSTGDTVQKGQPLALMGSTGRSTGPHVHVEVLEHGTQVNPARFLSH